MLFEDADRMHPDDSRLGVGGDHCSAETLDQFSNGARRPGGKCGDWTVWARGARKCGFRIRHVELIGIQGQIRGVRLNLSVIWDQGAQSRRSAISCPRLDGLVDRIRSLRFHGDPTQLFAVCWLTSSGAERVLTRSRKAI